MFFIFAYSLKDFWLAPLIIFVFVCMLTVTINFSGAMINQLILHLHIRLHSAGAKIGSWSVGKRMLSSSNAY